MPDSGLNVYRVFSALAMADAVIYGRINFDMLAAAVMHFVLSIFMMNVVKQCEKILWVHKFDDAPF